MIDGSATISSQASNQAIVQGQGIIFLTGTFAMKNALMCVKTTGSGNSTHCDTSPGAWNVEARQASLAERPALITPYPGAYRVVPARLPAGPDTPPTIEVAPTAFTYLDSRTQTRPEPRDITPPPVPEELTPERLAQAYRRAAGNLTRAARLLGVHRATLYRRMQALGLTRDDLAAALNPTSSLSTGAEG